MRDFLSNLLKTSALAGIAIAGLTAMVGQAVAQSPQPLFMPLGEAAPAPVGYLKFCARRPDQCGSKAEVDVRGRPIGAEARSREFIAMYFWSVAFASGQPSSMRLTPTSGVSTGPASAAPSTGRYGWSATFGANQPAMRAPTVTRAALATRPVANAWAAVAAAGDGRPIALPERAADGAVDFAGGVAVDFAGGVEATANDAVRPLAAAQPAQDQNLAVQPLQTNHALLAELDRVNLRINGAIRYVSDRTLYGEEDNWRLPLDAGGRAEGDCKDYVLEKRRALIADGVPAADLSIAIVETSWGEMHAVLLVTTDRGELVLDNLSSWVKPWQDVPYRWIERQAPGQPLIWVRLG